MRLFFLFADAGSISTKTKKEREKPYCQLKFIIESFFLFFFFLFFFFLFIFFLFFSFCFLIYKSYQKFFDSEHNLYRKLFTMIYFFKCLLPLYSMPFLPCFYIRKMYLIIINFTSFQIISLYLSTPISLSYVITPNSLCSSTKSVEGAVSLFSLNFKGSLLGRVINPLLPEFFLS